MSASATSRCFAIGSNPGLLLLASAALLLATNVQLASAVCEDLEAACQVDEVCLDCLTDTQLAEDVSVTECSARYPDVWDHQAIEGYTAGFCGSSGAMYCCALEDNDAAETCMDNTAAASYWNCLMDDIGCVVEDMPCYGGDQVLVLEGDELPATPAPVAATNYTPSPFCPVPSSSCSSSSPSFSSSPSSSSPPSSSSSSSVSDAILVCGPELAACEGDAACSGCTAARGHYSPDDCPDRYPDAFYYNNGEGGSGTICEEQGASYCCGWVDHAAAETCMDNALLANLVGCYVAGSGCTIEDVPCYGNGTPSPTIPTPAPTGPAPTAADNPGPNVELTTDSTSPEPRPPTPPPVSTSSPLPATSFPTETLFPLTETLPPSADGLVDGTPAPVATGTLARTAAPTVATTAGGPESSTPGPTTVAVDRGSVDDSSALAATPSPTAGLRNVLITDTPASPLARSPSGSPTSFPDAIGAEDHTPTPSMAAPAFGHSGAPVLAPSGAPMITGSTAPPSFAAPSSSSAAAGSGGATSVPSPSASAASTVSPEQVVPETLASAGAINVAGSRVAVLVAGVAGVAGLLFSAAGGVLL